LDLSFPNWLAQWAKDRRCVGFDSTQALYHAMQLVAVQLYLSEAHQRGDLYWDRPGNGYGYPLPLGGREIGIGDDKKL
jgi:hypothetical protein